MKDFIVIFLRFQQATDYKMESRGRSSLAMDLPFSEGQEMKTQLSVWKHIQDTDVGPLSQICPRDGRDSQGSLKSRVL